MLRQTNQYVIQVRSHRMYSSSLVTYQNSTVETKKTYKN